MRARAALLALACIGVTTAAQAHPTAEIVAFGRTLGERAPAADPRQGGTGLAPARSMSRMRFIDHSDTVEARLCRSFGMRLSITPGPGEAEPTAIAVRVLHPLFTGPDGRTSAEDDFPSAVVFGQSHVGFTFDHDWERVPGTWTLAAYAGGVPIAVKRFTVASPPASAPTSDCGGELF